MNVARCVSSMATSSRQTRASAPRATTMSLRATRRSTRRTARGRGLAAMAEDPGLDRHPFLDPVVAGDDEPEDGVELARLGLREEADLAEVDAEERDVDVGHGPRGAQERAVATEDDQRIGRRELADEGLRDRPTGPATPRCRGSGTSRRRGRSARRRPRSSGCRRSRCARPSRAGRPRRCARRSRHSRARARGRRGTRGCPPDP